MESLHHHNSRVSQKLNKENSFSTILSSSQTKNNKLSIQKIPKTNDSKREIFQSLRQLSELNNAENSNSNIQVLREIGMSSSTTQGLLRHTKSTIESREEDFFNDLKAREQQSMKKKDKIRMQTEVDELRECYFSPKINKNSKETRPLSNFLDDQQKYEAMKKQKKEQLVEQLKKDSEKDLTLVPRINQQSKRDTSVPIHERLYSLTRESLKTQESQTHPAQLSDRIFFTEGTMNTQATAQTASLFSPTINAKSKALTRKQPIDVLLYSDAKRRQEKEKTQQVETVIPSAQINDRSELVFATSFNRLFEDAWESLQKIGSMKGGDTAQIDYLRMNKILQILLFITNQESISTEKKSNPNIAKERSLVYDLWVNLKGDKLNGVSKRNLLNFLFAVQGLRITVDKDFKLSLPKHSDSKSIKSENQLMTLNSLPDEMNVKMQHKRDYGYFSGDIWWVGDDMQLIKQKYSQLLKTRLNQQQIRNLSPKVQRDLQASKPKADNKLSASSFGSHSMLESQNKFVQIELKRTHSPLARFDMLVQQRINQKQRHAEQKEIEKDKELEGCSFQPNLDRCYERLKSNPSIGNQKTLSLHTNYQKPASQRRDKATIDLEYEKSCDECTFHPDISLTKNQTRRNESTSQDRFYEKTVSRMRQARQDSHNISVQLQRGYSNTPCYQITSQNQSKKANSSVSSVQHFRSIDSEKQNHSIKMMNENNEVVKCNSNLLTNEDEQNSSSIEHINQSAPSDRRNPLLFVDVNIDPEKSERIVIYEGDQALQLAREFSMKHNLDEKTMMKLEEMLLTQMKSLIDNYSTNDNLI